MSVSIIVKKGIIRLPSFNMKTGIDRINLIILQTLFFGNVLSIYLSIGINVSSQNGIESRAMASYASWIFVKNRDITTAPIAKIPIMIIHVIGGIRAGEFIILYRKVGLNIFCIWVLFVHSEKPFLINL